MQRSGRGLRTTTVSALAVLASLSGSLTHAQGAPAAQNPPPPAGSFADPTSIPPAIRPLTSEELADIKRLTGRAQEAKAAANWEELDADERRILTITRNTLGLNHPSTVPALSGLKLALLQRGETTAADEIARSILKIYVGAFGERHPLTGLAYRNLAVDLQNQHRLAEAEPLLRRALEIGYETLSPSDPQLSRYEGYLGDNLMLQRHYAEAETLLRKALARGPTETTKPEPVMGELLEYLGEDLANQKRFNEAETAFRKALIIRRAALGETNEATAETYRGLGDNLFREHRFSEAEPLFRSALQIDHAVIGDAKPHTALDDLLLAKDLDDLSRSVEAEPLYRKSLAINRGYGESSPETAASELGLADNLIDHQGRYLEAEPLLEAALKTATTAFGDNSPEAAAVYGRLAHVKLYIGPDEEVEPFFRKALAITVAAFGDSSAEVATNYENLATYLQVRGRYTEAEPLLRKSLAIRSALFGDADPYTIISYTSLGLYLVSVGRYAEAEPPFRKALDLRRIVLGETHYLTGESYNNLATSVLKLGRPQQAERLFRKALEILQVSSSEAPENIANCNNNLADSLDAQGQYEKAVPLYQKALAIDRAAFGENFRDMGGFYINLALNLQRQHKSAEADTFFRKGVRIFQARFGDNHPQTALAYSLAVDNLDDLGRSEDAEALAARAVTIARRVRDIGSGVLGTGAETSLLQARAASGDGPEPLRRVYASYTEASFGAASGSSARAEGLRGNAFVAVQDLTASAAAQSMALAAARRAAGSGPLGDKVERQQSLTSKARGIDQQQITALGRGDALVAEHLGVKLDQTLADLAAVNDAITKDFPAYAQLTHPAPLSIAEVQARLAPDEGLILITPVLGDTFSFAISKNAVAWSRLAAGRASVADKVKRLRAQMGTGGRGIVGLSEPHTSERPARFERRLAFELYRDLVKPVEGALGGVQRLYVVASGPLGDLPLGVLMTQPHKEGSDDDADKALADPKAPWLGQRYAFSTLPSVSSLAAQNRQSDKDGLGRAVDNAAPATAFVGYGDPILAGPAEPSRGSNGEIATTGSAVKTKDDALALADPDWLRSQLPSLPGSALELPQMALYLHADPKTSVHLASEDTEAAVKGDPLLSRAVVVAFATHGLLRAPGLKEPGLVFTPPKTATPEDDGVLTASEAAQLRLSADWVILSACDTATSDPGAGGAGLSSLAQGFLYAGAGALLASHWPVSDTVTATLTTETLALRQSGLTRAKALQAAMLEVRTGKRADGSTLTGWSPQWSNPSLWGPFTIITNHDR